MTERPSAYTIISAELQKFPPGQRAGFLREIIISAAAGIQIIDGQERAASVLYGLADEIATRGLPCST